jgi:phosphomannomutase
MRKHNPIIAGEESGGLSIKGHIPEKDGVLANLLILEAMAYENKTLVQLQRDLKSFVGCEFINTRVDKKLEKVSEVKPVLEKFGAMEEIVGQKVSKKDFKDGVKLYLEDGTTWILVRPSGTEPLLRIYIESDSQDKIDEIVNFVK